MLLTCAFVALKKHFLFVLLGFFHGFSRIVKGFLGSFAIVLLGVDFVHCALSVFLFKVPLLKDKVGDACILAEQSFLSWFGVLPCSMTFFVEPSDYKELAARRIGKNE